jgi:hypothetical protein
MTKMDMVWVAVATMLHPDTSLSKTLTRNDIEAQVSKLFGASLTPVMIERHLVSTVDRMADKDQPQRGGSRNRYLFRTSDGKTPSQDGRFRLYKETDARHDGWEKTGPTHPKPSAKPSEHRHLVEWYTRDYANAPQPTGTRKDA